MARKKSPKIDLWKFFNGLGDREKSGEKGGPPAKDEPFAFLDFSSPEAAINALTKLIREYYRGNLKDEKLRSITYTVQTIVGLLRAAIEARQVMVEEARLEHEKHVHETVRKLLEQQNTERKVRR